MSTDMNPIEANVCCIFGSGHILASWISMVWMCDVNSVPVGSELSNQTQFTANMRGRQSDKDTAMDEQAWMNGKWRIYPVVVLLKTTATSI